MGEGAGPTNPYPPLPSPRSATESNYLTLLITRIKQLYILEDINTAALHYLQN